MTLARNAAYNLLGAAVPAVLSLLTIPYIVRSLGTADFGLLTLVTAIVGYFAIIDINMTAGSTRYVAQYRTCGDAPRLHATICFGLVVYLGIGSLGMLALLAGAEFIAGRLPDMPAEHQGTAVLALRIAALGFLFGQLQAYLNSLPGAMLRYDVSGRIEAAFGTLLPLATVTLLALGQGLIGVIVLRVALSAVQIGVLALSLRRLLPAFAPAWPDAALRRQLLSFSGYSFLSRLAAVTYAQADKLMIGARLGLSAVAHYAVPTTLSNRVMSLVFRLSGVMLPHASALATAGRHEELADHYLTATRHLFYLNGCIALLLAGLAQPMLALWIGPDFARAGATVMALIALAQWVDSTTNLPSLVNDAVGHPRVTGVFALARAVLGLGCIGGGIELAGIVGAAAGHLVASLLMAAVFVRYVHGRSVPVALGPLWRQSYAGPLLWLVPVAALAFGLAPWADTWWRLCVALSVVIGVAAAGGWWGVLSPALRKRLQARLLRGGPG